ncbi:MAG: UDPglucose--hexose-phosphate uridylyltransferase [Solirubrobacterales bacterium]|nr:UDPglucose--hexose-phosphate uridylyltransferase [Solirubrobacterales bacterium]MDX6663047.1 UDPglucose--hexose-phosphate uridylyltransferase [Solirubrobacterales bacterium]
MSEPEVRIDQLTGLRTLLAAARADRPGSLKPPRSDQHTDPSDCAFCEGHEDRTPAELFANRPGGGETNGPGWLTRVVPNLYPALNQTPSGAQAAAAAPAAAAPDTGLASPADPLASSRRGAEPDLFSRRPASGSHEVIIHSPEHHSSLLGLDEEGFAAAIEAWRQRMRDHAEAAYCHLIVNEGAAAGASLEHSHAQLYAMTFVPADVARERERFGSYAERTMGGALLQDIGAEEVRRGERLVAIDDECILICPWASRGPFELRVLPRQAAAGFGEDGSGTAMLRTAMQALAKRFDGLPPYNLWVRTAPRGAEHFHWHIDLLPRLAVRAGFEIGTGVEICTYEPERAASDLRECLA